MLSGLLLLRTRALGHRRLPAGDQRIAARRADAIRRRFTCRALRTIAAAAAAGVVPRQPRAVLAVQLRLERAQRTHKLPALDAAVAVDVEDLEDGLCVEQVQREPERVERRRELGDVEAAAAVAVPSLEGTANVELLVEDGLRHSEHGTLDIFIHLEGFAVERHALEVRRRHRPLRVAVRANSRAHELDHLDKLHGAVSIAIKFGKGRA